MNYLSCAGEGGTSLDAIAGYLNVDEVFTKVLDSEPIGPIPWGWTRHATYKLT